VASIARDVGSSSTNRFSDIMHKIIKSDKYQHRSYANKTEPSTVSGPELSVSKLSDIATITNFSILLPSPLPPEIPAASHPTIRVRRCQ